MVAASPRQKTISGTASRTQLCRRHLGTARIKANSTLPEAGPPVRALRDGQGAIGKDSVRSPVHALWRPLGSGKAAASGSLFQALRAEHGPRCPGQSR